MVIKLTNAKFDKRKRCVMEKIYGYCRISTKKQSIERQIRNIKEAYPTAIIVEEEYTGTTIDRKKWNKLYHQVKPGDTIVFDSVSRMSRNAAEGFEAYEKLYHQGVSLVFLKEPHINTATFKKALSDADLKRTGTNVDFILEGVSKYLMSLAKEQIKIAFAQSEKEVQDLHRRTSEGIETARLHGKQIGQRKGAKLTTKKSIAAKEIIKRYNKSFGGGLSNENTWKLAGISKMTFYKYQRELLTELSEGEIEMKIGQKFHAVDRLGLETEWIFEGVEDGVYQSRAIGATLERCEKDIQTSKGYGIYNDKEYDDYVTIHVKQDWFDNRKITLLD